MKNLYRAIALLAVAGLGACDSLMVAPASAPASLAIRIAPSLSMQPDTFKQADRAVVRVVVEGDTTEKTFDFAPGQDSIVVRMEVEMRGSEAPAVVTIDLLRDDDVLFSGSKAVTLRKGIQQAVDLPVGVVDYCARAEPIAQDATVNGALVPDRDCLAPPGRYRAYWELNLTAPTVLQVTLTSTAFAPFVTTRTPGADGIQLTGRTSSTATVVAENAFPAGTYWLSASHQAATAQVGAYTLATRTINEPQSGLTDDTGVIFGTSVSGRVTSADRRDSFGDTSSVRRYDGYSILLQAGEAVTVTLRADFPTDLTRWGSAFQEAIFDIPANQTRSMTFTSSTTAFFGFYVIADQHNGGGNYTLSFARATAAPQPSITLRTITSGGTAANVNDLQGTVVATFAVTAPAGAGIARFEATIGNQGCNQALGAAQQGTFDLQCTIDTRLLPNGSHVLQGRLIAASGSTFGSALLTVRVNNQAAPAIASVTVSPSSAAIAPNATVQYSVTARDAGGNTVPAGPVTWSSSNTAVATISSAGLATARAAGSATITASAGSLSSSASLTVTTAQTSLVGRWNLISVNGAPLPAAGPTNICPPNDPAAIRRISLKSGFLDIPTDSTVTASLTDTFEFCNNTSRDSLEVSQLTMRRNGNNLILVDRSAPSDTVRGTVQGNRIDVVGTDGNTYNFQKAGSPNIPTGTAPSERRIAPAGARGARPAAPTWLRARRGPSFSSAHDFDLL